MKCVGKGLKINAGKCKVMVLGREEGLECEDCINKICLEHVLELKYLDVFWMNHVQMRQSIVERW